MTLKVAALASGRGSNVAAIIKAIDEKKLDAKIVLVLSNNPEAKVIDFAKSCNIPVWAESHVGLSREEFDARLIHAIRLSGADTVVLAGYMRLVSSFFVAAFPKRIVNIHPALLPSFAGAHGGRDATDYGVKISGVTVHFVDEVMDNGPIIIQGAVPMADRDTEESLMARIHTLEHVVYPQALQWLAEGRLKVEGRKVRLLPSASKEKRNKKIVFPFPCLISPPLEA